MGNCQTTLSYIWYNAYISFQAKWSNVTSTAIVAAPTRTAPSWVYNEEVLDANKSWASRDDEQTATGDAGISESIIITEGQEETNRIIILLFDVGSHHSLERPPVVQ